MTQSDIIGNLRRELYSIARSLETKRFVYLAWLLVGIGIVSFFMTFLILYLNPEGVDIRYTVTFGALLPSMIIYMMLSQGYTSKAQAAFIAGLCRATGFRHRPDGCFAVSAMEKHKILPEHNKSHLGTGLQGNYGHVAIDVQEVVLTALRQDPKHKKRKKEFLRFWGLLVRIKLNRATEGHTVAIPRTAMKTFFLDHFSKYETVKLPEGRFTQMFDIKSTDKVEAKFVLNAGFKDRFIEAGKTLKVYWSEASFKGDEILLAFQRFQPLIRVDPLWKPVDEKNLRKNAEELESLLRIIDALKANPQVGI